MDSLYNMRVLCQLRIVFLVRLSEIQIFVHLTEEFREWTTYLFLR